MSQFVFNMLNVLCVGGQANLIYIVLQGRMLTHFCTLENCISSDRKYHTFNTQAGVIILFLKRMASKKKKCTVG